MWGEGLTTETSIYEYAKQGLQYGADRTAIWFYGKSISYGELFEKIDNVADHFYALGVREGTVVTIHLPNCPQAVMAIYAVAKLGGICNMVHALTPWSVLQDVMVRARSEMLITGDHFADNEIHAEKHTIYVSLNEYMGLFFKIAYSVKSCSKALPLSIPFSDLTGSVNKRNAVPVSAPHCPAIYLQSSGTESEPKIVVHSHYALNSWEADADKYYNQFQQSNRSILCVLPFFHGFGLVTGLHHGLTNGMEVVLMLRFSAEDVVKTLHRRKINIVIGTPALFEKLMKDRRFNGRYLPFLDECTVGGDCTSEKLIDDFDLRLDHTGKRKFLFEGYGLTEFISAVSYNNYHFSYQYGTAGKLLPGVAACVRNGDTIAHEGVGEILLSGNTMMLGYLDEEKSPFVEYEGKRWFPTGDFGRLDRDGYISCFERLKDVIIHNGYNVIPSRVEFALKDSSMIKDVFITGGKKPDSTSQIVVAWIVPQENIEKSLLRTEINKCCKEKLAPYEWPGQLRVVKALPRNHMNKIDRRALRECQWTVL